MEIRPASSGDIPAIAALLVATELPAIDTANFQGDDFRILWDGSRAMGAVGIERYDHEALLRSLVVAPEARGQKIGESLVRAIERHAAAAGVKELLLLTTTAEKFFERLGYETIPRSAMPAGVQRSTEFSTLCPASATCMRKVVKVDVRP